jgi:hypothetical protein
MGHFRDCLKIAPQYEKRGKSVKKNQMPVLLLKPYFKIIEKVFR